MLGWQGCCLILEWVEHTLVVELLLWHTYMLWTLWLLLWLLMLDWRRQCVLLPLLLGLHYVDTIMVLSKAVAPATSG